MAFLGLSGSRSADALCSRRRHHQVDRPRGHYRAGRDDLIKPYVLLVNSFDGSTALRMARSETGSRRIDVAEFIEFCGGCGVEPAKAITDLMPLRR